MASAAPAVPDADSKSSAASAASSSPSAVATSAEPSAAQPPPSTALQALQPVWSPQPSVHVLRALAASGAGGALLPPLLRLIAEFARTQTLFFTHSTPPSDPAIRALVEANRNRPTEVVGGAGQAVAVAPIRPEAVAFDGVFAQRAVRTGDGDGFAETALYRFDPFEPLPEGHPSPQPVKVCVVKEADAKRSPYENCVKLLTLSSLPAAQPSGVPRLFGFVNRAFHFVHDISEFDWRTGAFDALAPLPVSRSNFECCAVPDHHSFLIAGGYERLPRSAADPLRVDDEEKATLRVDIFHVPSNTWQRGVAPLPASDSRHFHRIAAIGSFVYLCGSADPKYDIETGLPIDHNDNDNDDGDDDGGAGDGADGADQKASDTTDAKRPEVSTATATAAAPAAAATAAAANDTKSAAQRAKEQEDDDVANGYVLAHRPPPKPEQNEKDHNAKKNGDAEGDDDNDDDDDGDGDDIDAKVPHSDCVRYDMQRNVWEPIGPMNFPGRLGMVLCAFGGKLYAAGGHLTMQALAYCTAQSPYGAAAEQRVHPSAVDHDALARVSLPTCMEVYDPATDRWTVLPPSAGLDLHFPDWRVLPDSEGDVQRDHCAVVCDGERLAVLGTAYTMHAPLPFVSLHLPDAAARAIESAAAPALSSGGSGGQPAVASATTASGSGGGSAGSSAAEAAAGAAAVAATSPPAAVAVAEAKPNLWVYRNDLLFRGDVHAAAL